MKKGIMAISLILVALLSMMPLLAQGASDSGSASGAMDKITIAYHPHITGLGAVLEAEENGYFDEENLDVEFVQFTSGASELAAMASGDIDLGYLGVGAHVFAPQGRCVILSMDSTDLSAEILVRADSGIESFEDLKGKTIAISAGTTSEMMVSMALDKYGMDKSDVSLVNMDNSGKIPAFVSGRIDAMAAESPFTDEVRSELGADNVVTLVSSFDFLPEKVFPQSWVATTVFVEKNPDIVLRFMRAYLKGIDDRYSHIEETTQKVADYIHTDYDIAYQVVGRTNFIDTAEMKKLAEDGTTYRYYDGLTDLFIEAGLLDPQYDIPAEEYVDLSFMLQALEDIGK